MGIIVKALAAIQTIGSVFAKSGDSGKPEVAVGPFVVVYSVGMSLACYTQTSEPFSQCVKTIFSAIGG